MSTSNTNDGAILRHQGTLEKQGKIFGSWKKYWFVLKDDQLIYHKEESKSRSVSTIIFFTKLYAVLIILST